MNYPKMLYKGEAKYSEHSQIRDDLTNKTIKTVIVITDQEEQLKREDGYVDLSELMEKPKTLRLPAKDNVRPNTT